MQKHASNHFASRFSAVLVAACLALPGWVQAAEIFVGQADRHDTSPRLSDMALPAPTVAPGSTVEVPIMRRPGPGPVEPANVQPDGGLSSPAWQMAPTPSTRA